MGKGYRQGRLGGEIQKIISSMLMNGIKDPRLSGMISITDVDVTGDGSYAKCLVTVLDTSQEEEKKTEKEQEVLDGLKSAKGLFKREIGKQMKIRHIPELLFEIDRSLEYGRKIDSIIDSLDIQNYQSNDNSDEEDDF